MEDAQKLEVRTPRAGDRVRARPDDGHKEVMLAHERAAAS